MALAIAIFKAIAALPALAGYAKEFAQALIGWYLENQKSETLAMLADAAAKGARAQTDEERYAAAQAWHDALSSARVSS